ncbi:MAG: hypothetical protein Q9217_006226 [Psora testacea]
MYRARLATLFQGANPRVCVAFWLFGLINNVLYVIILSAALDLVGPHVPKAAVLLCDVIPSFFAKLLLPYVIYTIPYTARIILFVALSTWGMLLIALTPPYTDGGTITTKMSGVVLASLSSGAGELSFLALTHFYGPFSLAAWGSGTGGAGLIGAGMYAVATTSLGMSSKGALFTSAFLPIVMLVSFFLILPRGPLNRNSNSTMTSVLHEAEERDDDATLPRTTNGHEEEGLLQRSSNARPPSLLQHPTHSWRTTFLHNIRRSRSLFIPYMLPLLLVYIAEYIINQSVSPTLLFSLSSTPFHHYRAFYPTYNAIYQSGVFVSRSSTPFIRIHNLYLPSLLQCVNLGLLVMQALFDFIPSVYIIFVVVFWEGLLGGAVYVNTFAEISERVDKPEREFSLGAVTVSDSAGICIAGLLGMGVETALCGWQVRHGRNWCREL